MSLLRVAGITGRAAPWPETRQFVRRRMTCMKSWNRFCGSSGARFPRYPSRRCCARLQRCSLGNGASPATGWRQVDRGSSTMSRPVRRTARRAAHGGQFVARRAIRSAPTDPHSPRSLQNRDCEPNNSRRRSRARAARWSTRSREARSPTPPARIHLRFGQPAAVTAGDPVCAPACARTNCYPAWPSLRVFVRRGFTICSSPGLVSRVRQSSPSESHHHCTMSIIAWRFKLARGAGRHARTGTRA